MARQQMTGQHPSASAATESLRPAVSTHSIGGNNNVSSSRPQTIGATLTAAKSVNDLDQLLFNGGTGGGNQMVVPPPLASAAPGMHYYQV